MIKVPRNFLILGMGTGKTVCTLTVFNELKYNRFEVRNMLVIGPPRVIENTWPGEVTEWSHLSHLTVTTINGTAKKRIEKLKEHTDIHKKTNTKQTQTQQIQENRQKTTIAITPNNT